MRKKRRFALTREIVWHHRLMGTILGKMSHSTWQRARTRYLCIIHREMDPWEIHGEQEPADLSDIRWGPAKAKAAAKARLPSLARAVGSLRAAQVFWRHMLVLQNIFEPRVLWFYFLVCVCVASVLSHSAFSIFSWCLVDFQRLAAGFCFFGGRFLHLGWFFSRRSSSSSTAPKAGLTTGIASRCSC